MDPAPVTLQRSKYRGGGLETRIPGLKERIKESEKDPLVRERPRFGAEGAALVQPSDISDCGLTLPKPPERSGAVAAQLTTSRFDIRPLPAPGPRVSRSALALRLLLRQSATPGWADR